MPFVIRLHGTYATQCTRRRRRRTNWGLVSQDNDHNSRGGWTARQASLHLKTKACNFFSGSLEQVTGQSVMWYFPSSSSLERILRFFFSQKNGNEWMDKRKSPFCLVYRRSETFLHICLVMLSLFLSCPPTQSSLWGGIGSLFVKQVSFGFFARMPSSLFPLICFSTSNVCPVSSLI